MDSQHSEENSKSKKLLDQETEQNKQFKQQLSANTKQILELRQEIDQQLRNKAGEIAAIKKEYETREASVQEFTSSKVSYIEQTLRSLTTRNTMLEA